MSDTERLLEEGWFCDEHGWWPGYRNFGAKPRSLAEAIAFLDARESCLACLDAVGAVVDERGTNSGWWLGDIFIGDYPEKADEYIKMYIGG